MARRRRKRRSSSLFPAVLVLTGAAVGLSWIVFGPTTPPADEPTLVATTAQKPPLTTDRPEILPVSASPSNVTEKGDNPKPVRSNKPVMLTGERVAGLIKAGDDAVARDDLVAARTHYAEALAVGIDGPDAPRVRAELMRIAQETIFSPRIFDNDPYAHRYTIKPGDALAKIAKVNKISDDLLAAINGIPDKNRIRAGQVIKVVTGPFRVVVDKGSFALDVYVGDTFLKRFRVGLGQDNSTPTGEWRVGTKLMNPTYYPPRGGDVIAADDPLNPLGEHWIGLVGISGAAAGQQRYGIHGTIEPESIGKSMSLGCVRMYNEDVALLYTYLVERHSTVMVND